MSLCDISRFCDFCLVSCLVSSLDTALGLPGVSPSDGNRDDRSAILPKPWALRLHMQRATTATTMTRITATTAPMMAGTIPPLPPSASTPARCASTSMGVRGEGEGGGITTGGGLYGGGGGEGGGEDTTQEPSCRHQPSRTPRSQIQQCEVQMEGGEERCSQACVSSSIEGAASVQRL